MALFVLQLFKFFAEPLPQLAAPVQDRLVEHTKCAPGLSWNGHVGQDPGEQHRQDLEVAFCHGRVLAAALQEFLHHLLQRAAPKLLLAYMPENQRERGYDNPDFIVYGDVTPR